MADDLLTEMVNEVGDGASAGADSNDKSGASHDSSLKNDSDGGNGAGAGQKLSDEDISKFLSERLGVKDGFSLDKVRYGDPEPTEAKFASDRIKAINEFVATTGRNEMDWFRTQTTDLSKETPESLLKAMMYEEDSDLTLEDLNLLFDEKYGMKQLVKIDDDMLDEEREAAEKHNSLAEKSNKLKEISLRKDAKAATKYFEELQAKYRLPDTNAPKNPLAEFEANTFKTALKDHGKSMSEIEIDLGDKETFLYEVKNQSSFEAVTPADLIAEFRNKDGSFDTEGWNTLMYINKNMGDMLKAQFVRGVNAGKENLEKDMKNTNLGDKDSGRQSSGSSKSAEDVIFDQMM
jgi:hypothetical protein